MDNDFHLIQHLNQQQPKCCKFLGQIKIPFTISNSNILIYTYLTSVCKCTLTKFSHNRYNIFFRQSGQALYIAWRVVMATTPLLSCIVPSQAVCIDCCLITCPMWTSFAKTSGSHWWIGVGQSGTPVLLQLVSSPNHQCIHLRMADIAIQQNLHYLCWMFLTH